jgi:hypothetical protein
MNLVYENHRGLGEVRLPNHVRGRPKGDLLAREARQADLGDRARRVLVGEPWVPPR